MKKILDAYKAEGRKVLVGYYPLGDPAMGEPLARIGEFLESGVDVLELGLPYENPSLDGAVVRGSMERALSVSDLQGAFDLIGQIRRRYPDACLQIFTYHEIIEKMGLAEFCARAEAAGADGAMSPNADDAQTEKLGACLESRNLIMPRFAPFRLCKDEAAEVVNTAKGYVFVQAQDGKTGAQKTVPSQVGDNIALLRSLNSKVPLYAGFGISCPEQIAKLMGMGADGVIVGSSIITSVLTGSSQQYISSLRRALDR